MKNKKRCWLSDLLTVVNGDWIFDFSNAYNEIREVFNSNSKVLLQIVRHEHYGRTRKREYVSGNHKKTFPHIIGSKHGTFDISDQIRQDYTNISSSEINSWVNDLMRASNKTNIRRSWREKLGSDPYYLKFSFVLVFQNIKLVGTETFKFYYPSLGNNYLETDYNLNLETMEINKQ